MLSSLPLVRESRTVLNSGFHAADFRFQLLDSEVFVSGSQIPDSTLQWDSRFQIPIAVFRIPRPRIPDFFLESGKESGFPKAGQTFCEMTDSGDHYNDCI